MTPPRSSCSRSRHDGDRAQLARVDASQRLCPLPPLLDGGHRIRVLCAFLDCDRIGRCGWVDVGGERPDRVLALSERPALDVGLPGTFDEHGVTPLALFRLLDCRLWLDHAGRERGGGVRDSLFTGAVESRTTWADIRTRLGRADPRPDLPTSCTFARAGTCAGRATDGACGRSGAPSGRPGRTRSRATRYATSAGRTDWPGRAPATSAFSPSRPSSGSVGRARSSVTESCACGSRAGRSGRATKG